MRGRGRDLGQRDLGQRPKSGGRYTNPRVETHISVQRPRSQGRDPRWGQRLRSWGRGPSLGAETQIPGQRPRSPDRDPSLGTETQVLGQTCTMLAPGLSPATTGWDLRQA